MSWNTTPGTAWPTPKPPITDPEILEWEKLGQDDLLIAHQQMKLDLAIIKERELKMRTYIVGRAFPQANEGMNKLDLGNGYELKAGVKYNYSCGDYKTTIEGLRKIAALGNEGPFIAERLVSFTPNFLLTEYRKLQDDAEKGSPFAKQVLSVIPEFLTITDATPTLEIKEPRKKK
jgi:hypothetical protein